MHRKTLKPCVVFGLVLGVGLACGCTQQPGQWWFSTVAPAERERQYHIAFTFNSPDRHIEDYGECTVTVIMEATPDQQALIWRLVDAEKQCGTSSILGLWMWWIQFVQDSKDRGTGVTTTEVRFGDWPLLWGPWRAGDRLQMTTLFFTLFSVRAEVLSADTERVALRFDFLGAWGSYRWKGSGELSMAIDDEGLREVRGSWGGTSGAHDFDARLTIDRLPQLGKDGANVDADN